MKLTPPGGVASLERESSKVYNQIAVALKNSGLSDRQGVYVFYDGMGRAIYVGQCVAGKSQGGVAGRVQRHLTCGRSDNIAKRRFSSDQIYRIEIYYADEMTVTKARMDRLEGAVFHGLVTLDHRNMVNGTTPKKHAFEDVDFSHSLWVFESNLPKPTLEQHASQCLVHLGEVWRYTINHPSNGADENLCLSLCSVLESVITLKPEFVPRLLETLERNKSPDVR